MHNSNKQMVMESDFAFGFNDPKFSDRLLRIEVSCSSTEVSCSSPSVLRDKELHISSIVLAAKSPFFLKLFSNGMLESEKRDVTLNIDASEVAAVMELLNFMYSNSLSVTTAPALLDVLMAADKYEVASCMDYCSRLLLDMPWTVDFALQLLELPSSVVTADSFQPLRNAARQFLASHYKNLFKFPLKEIMALPLVAMEAIVASDELEILSEDELHNHVLKWAKTHYSDPQEILSSRIAPYIRFPHMTVEKLAEISNSNVYTPSLSSKIILGSLIFKGQSLHRQRRLAAQHPWSLGLRVTERAYKRKPIQIVEFEIPHHQCLDLTRKECAGLYPSSAICSQAFSLGGHVCGLYARCKMNESGSFHYFGLYLGVKEIGTGSPNVDYKFGARLKPTEEFVQRCVGYYDFADGMGKKLFSLPWDSVMDKDCSYFINDILHLRVELSIRG